MLKSPWTTSTGSFAFLDNSLTPYSFACKIAAAIPSVTSSIPSKIGKKEIALAGRLPAHYFLSFLFYG
jgi:hypothetical protein